MGKNHDWSGEITDLRRGANHYESIRLKYLAFNLTISRI